MAQLKITAQAYESLQATGKPGWQKITEQFDEAVDDLVSNRRLVPASLEGNLRAWLYQCVPDYFDALALRRIVTELDEQDREVLRQINDRLDDLECKCQHAASLPELRCVAQQESPANKNLIDIGDGFLVTNWQQEVRLLYPANASKTALHWLGDDIRCFAMTDWGTALRQRPELALGSAYTEVASYLYNFVDQTCGGRSVVERLRRVEKYHSCIPPQFSNYRLLRKRMTELEHDDYKATYYERQHVLRREWIVSPEASDQIHGVRGIGHEIWQ